MTIRKRGSTMKMLPRLIATLMIAFAPMTIRAAEPAPTHQAAIAALKAQLPAKAEIINDPSVAWRINGRPSETKTVAAATVVGGKAISIAVEKRGDNPWDVSVIAPIIAPIAKGDTLFLAVQLRASAANNEAQSGVISSSKIEENSAPYTIIADTAGQVSDKWTTFYSAGIAAQDYPIGATHITVHLAGARQTIEVGSAYAFNLGPDVKLSALPSLKITYPGRAKDAAWRAGAQKRIEAIRKGDIEVSVTSAAGKPISGATVKIEMLRHAFHFGSFVGHNITTDTDEAKKLRETFPQMFNTATSPIYWQDWGWQNANMRRSYEASMKYLAAQNTPWRAHTVIYPGEPHVPSYLKALADDPAAYKKAVLDHVRDVAAITAKFRPFAYDVINEPRDDNYTINRIGIDGVAEAFRIVKAAAPDAHLFVNDYAIISGGGWNEKNIAFYHDYLDRLVKAGAPVSGIGMQGHFGAALTDPVRVLAIFDDFARHKMPIQITEFDIDTNDEQAQADYTRDLLTVAFSHPSVEAFTTWGWWQGDHWRGNAAMLRADWSPKPNFHAWRQLVFSDWWTNQTLPTDATGDAKLRGFLGHYRVTVTANGTNKIQEFDLTKTGARVAVKF
jgi:endo-1,4-beta-xylanase